MRSVAARRMPRKAQSDFDRAKSVRGAHRGGEDADRLSRHHGLAGAWRMRRVTYHGLGDTYALTIVPKGTERLRALAGCFALHIARADDVQRAQSLRSAEHAVLRPAAQIYAGRRSVLRRPPTASRTGIVPRVRASRDAAEGCRSRFARPARCVPATRRNLATQALGELQSYFATNAKAPSWTITSHAAARRHLVRTRSGRSQRHRRAVAVRPRCSGNRRRTQTTRLRRQSRTGNELRAGARTVFDSSAQRLRTGRSRKRGATLTATAVTRETL